MIKKEVDQASFFDKEVEYFASFQDQYDPHQSAVISYFIDYLSEHSQGKQVLEIGCGTGMYTIPLLQAGYSVTGVDLSQLSLDECRKRADLAGVGSNLELICASGISLSVPAEFDAVVGKHILHHVGDIEGTAGTCYRALKKGGVAIFMEPNPLCPLWAVYITVNAKRQWAIEKGIFDCFPGSLRKRFRAAGFDMAKSDYYGFIPASLVRIFPSLAKMNWLPNRLPFIRKVLALQLLIAKK